MEFSGKRFGEERALYNLKNSLVLNCKFQGEEDGESAMKECENVDVVRCKFYLRYPLWHCVNFSVKNCKLFSTCRAPLWYDKKGLLDGCNIRGVKPLRECDDMVVTNCTVTSTEVGWYCRNLEMKNCKVVSEYFLMQSKNVNICNLELTGKYSFQYLENAVVTDSVLRTKDAFWHAKNVVVKNCKVYGEYLGWYSDGLTFENCEICGTQPLCYCKNLKLVNCTMSDCDLSFEYSDVQAEIVGNIPSVKNPRSGKIVADSYGEVILQDAVFPLECEIGKR